MEWKETVTGLVIGSVLAGAGVLFLFQERISKLEVRVKQLEANSAAEEPKTPSSLGSTLDDVAGQWDGTWEHTEAIVGGTGAFTGLMKLHVKSAGESVQVTGWADNPQGGRSELDGHLSENGKVFSGDWYNPITKGRGKFLLELITPTLFRGNYALKGKPLSESTNSWSGEKK